MDPYFAKWLPRARKLLAPSGRITELAHVLAAESEHEVADWSRRLRRVLDGKEQPDANLVFAVEKFVAKPARERTEEATPELGLAS